MFSQPTDFSRSFYSIIKERLSEFTPFIQIITGPRQVGKTTAIKSLVNEISDRAYYFSFDNPGANPEEKIRFEWNKIANLPGHRLIVFDEIQNVLNWASIIKELYDEQRAKRKISVAILGSSALELLLTGDESLLGRFEIIRVAHWNAYETKKTFKWDLDRFLQFGGYPALAELNESSRSQAFIRDAIIEPVITRDIFSLREVANTAIFRQVLKIALALPCQEISFAKFLGQLAQKGSSATVKSYLELLEKAFLIKLLYRYSGSVIKQRTTSPKIVPLAPALIHAYSDPALIVSDPRWFGRVYESAVISRFLETGHEFYYWSDSRQDVDLVIKSDKFLCAIEIKSGQDFDTKGLKAFKAKYSAAKTLMLDRKTGEDFLLCEDSKSFLESLIKKENN